jgi:prevent-host-death family protein
VEGFARPSVIFSEVVAMLNIRPITDLRNNFADISKTVHENASPIFLTKNGYGDMVVMSIEAYENIVLENRISAKLKAAAIEAKQPDVWLNFSDVAEEMRARLDEKL